ncbi:MAG: ACT domain-containing protein, partial [Pseudomonadota bacterium]
CVAAKIDRRLMPLRTPLHNGQTIEVITAKGAKPNPAWLNFVVTAKARASIRAFLKNLRSNEAAVLGKKLLERALAEFKLTLRKVPKARFEAVLEELGLDSRNALFEQIGLGEHLAPLIARRLTADAAADAADSPGAQSGPLAIDGTEGMIVTYARCCFPLPGDRIMGHLSAGRGIVVHRATCGNLGEFRKQPDKFLSVEWRDEIEREFTAEIRVEVFNRLGVLAAVAAQIAETQTNIEHVSVVERDGDTSSLTFQLQLTSLKHYERVVKSISSMPDVLSVSRTCA